MPTLRWLTALSNGALLQHYGAAINPAPPSGRVSDSLV